MTARLLVVASLNRSVVEDLADSLARFPVAMTVEAHMIVGGLGSLVSEIVAERGLSCRVGRRGVEALATFVSGGERYLHELRGLSSDRLVEAGLQAVSGAHR